MSRLARPLRRFAATPAALLLGAALAVCASAAEPTGAAFLKIDPGARAMGMGSALTALADGVDALAWNPAALSYGARRAMASHAECLGDTSMDYAGVSWPTRRGGWGAGLSRFAGGRLEGRDEARRPTGDFSAADTVFAAGMARRLGAGGMGAEVKLLRQRIGTASAGGVAFDAGAMLKVPGSPWRAGAALRNLGPGVRFEGAADPLPLTASLGLGWEAHGLAVGADARRNLRAGGAEWSAGAEYWAGRGVALRGGYFLQAGRGVAPSARAAGWSGGVGLRLRGYSLDYALAPRGDLGLTQKLALTFNF